MMFRSTTRRSCDRILTVAPLGLAVGCSSNHAIEAMNQREYAPYRNRGSAVIVGQVTMTLKSGEILDGAACQVRLSPVTTETTRYIQEVVMVGDNKEWKDNSDAVWSLAQADEDGRFHFEEVPTGSYLTCPVAWHSATSGETKKRILYAAATVAPEETATVSVSR